MKANFLIIGVIGLLMLIGCKKTDDTVNHPRIFIPTAFSPDKNKVNDIFRPVGAALANIKEFEMSITDKSGNELFNTIDYIKGWDGLKSNGDPYENGFYFYEMWFKYNDKTEERVVGIIEIALNGW